MPVSPKQMPFFQHFAELRKRLTIIVIVIFVLSMVFYMEKCYVFLLDIFLAPVRAYLPGGKLTVLGPFEQMTFRFKVAFAASIIASMPVILYEIFAFITPALKPKEKKWVFPTVIAAVFLFLGGAAFAYFVIMGPAFQWLSSQGAGVISSMAAAGQYFSGISMLMIGFGIGFELPLVVFYLIGLGILKYDVIRGGWRYAYVAIVVIAAVAYFVLPYDVMPEEIYGPYGYLDDIFLCALVADRVRLEAGTDEILKDNWDGAGEIAPLIKGILENEKALIGDSRAKILRYLGYEHMLDIGLKK